MQLELYCLPFAGGSRYSYRQLSHFLPHTIKLIPLEYPGRGDRSDERLISDSTELVSDLLIQFRNAHPIVPYAIFGHSLGGLMAYLLTRRLSTSEFSMPVHLFVAGTSGPAADKRHDKKLHLLPERSFFQTVSDLNDDFNMSLDHPELRRYYEPILRSDFKVSETYGHKQSAPLNIRISVFSGDQEIFSHKELHQWQLESIYPVMFSKFPGSHFFIHKSAHLVAKTIATTLQGYLTKK